MNRRTPLIDDRHSYPPQRARPLLALAAIIATAAHVAFSAAADWKPSSQVEIVVPNSPGGGNDAVARLLQKIWQDRRLVLPAVIVVNKPAGGGSATLTYLGQKTNDPHVMAVVSITAASWPEMPADHHARPEQLPATHR